MRTRHLRRLQGPSFRVHKHFQLRDLIPCWCNTILQVMMKTELLVLWLWTQLTATCRWQVHLWSWPASHAPQAPAAPLCPRPCRCPDVPTINCQTGNLRASWWRWFLLLLHCFSFVDSLNKHLLSTYYVPGTLWGLCYYFKCLGYFGE